MLPRDYFGVIRDRARVIWEEEQAEFRQRYWGNPSDLFTSYDQVPADAKAFMFERARRALAKPPTPSVRLVVRSADGEVVWSNLLPPGCSLAFEVPALDGDRGTVCGDS